MGLRGVVELRLLLLLLLFLAQQQQQKIRAMMTTMMMMMIWPQFVVLDEFRVQKLQLLPMPRSTTR
jgi:hypothetical protein